MWWILVLACAVLALLVWVALTSRDRDVSARYSRSDDETGPDPVEP